MPDQINLENYTIQLFQDNHQRYHQLLMFFNMAPFMIIIL